MSIQGTGVTEHRPAAALVALLDAIRDNLPVDAWVVDQLLDLQPSPAHAKALLVSLAAHDLVPADEASEIMGARELEAV